MRHNNRRKLKAREHKYLNSLGNAEVTKGVHPHMGRRMLFYIDPIHQQSLSRDEHLRYERIEVGRMCKCGDCLCCRELEDYNHGRN